MKLIEIKREESAELHAIRNILKKQSIFMRWEQGDVWQTVEIVEAKEEFSDQGEHWLVVDYGWPNSRTGDINDDWRDAEFHMDKVCLIKDKKGVWWLRYDAE